MESAARVERAHSGDLAWLVSVDRHVSRDWVQSCVESEAYLVARRGDDAAGFLRHSMFWRSIPFMDLVFVDVRLRGKGVGSRLFSAWEDAARAAGAAMLMTSSMADEAEPQAWHRRNGFQPAGTLDLSPYQATPEIFFVKPL
ncbi:MAG: GNAT family N-acetyltransferase [Alphaproteobacteria bacterium]|nr:GNAT family N-acetyltransferase [Alphaproteobacteria bacterium]